MIPETSVNWKAFEYKYSDNPQRAFENLTYYLFCHEFKQKNGIFRYFNQPHIETNPIQVGDKLIGFQSKYYSDSVTMSDKENELIKAVRGAARSYPGITTFYFYISREFSPSSKKDIVVPSYQKNIEKVAGDIGIKIEWRGISNIEAQLMQDCRLTACRNVFFQPDSTVQKCCESLDKHKEDIFENISTSMKYKDCTIVLEHNTLKIEGFLNSSDQILIVDGDAGSGKSALVKQAVVNLNDDIAFLAFKSTDMDVNNKLVFLTLYGMLTIDEVLDVYKEADTRILYIDAVEKYFVLENQQTFEDILQVFIKAGWKLILTIRTAYKESFHNLLLDKVKVQQYHAELMSNGKLCELSNNYGFRLPNDKRLLDFLCAPFYLNLYLALDNLEDEERVALNREAFEEKIWEDIIRNNKKRKNNMPARREKALLTITLEMLQNENYMYEIQSSDDYEAFAELEQIGILNQTDDARKYYHGHDAFEELTVNRIFTEQYKKNVDSDQFFAPFRASLRVRKLFRGWLADFASIEEHQNIIVKILEDKRVDRIWKDEVLLTVISTENLKDVYFRIESNLADNNYEMLSKITFLINTCCRVAEHTEIYFNRGNLMPFRLSKPSGYAWKALFVYILDNKESISWNKELVTIIIDTLDSWTKHLENAKKENTGFAGKIGLFLLNRLSDDDDLKYSVRDEEVQKLQDVLVNSAWMIKEELIKVFQTVLDEIKGEEVVTFAVANRKSNALRMYADLAECAISDIYHYGNIPAAMPEMVVKLMKKIWIGQDEPPIYRSAEMNNYFGLHSHLSNKFFPPSAYRTPITNLLQNSLGLATDFLIDFCNKTGDGYANSYLNKEYKECAKIFIYVKGQKIEQIASDRLWKMYRGLHVGPDLLVSLLMGFELWLFTAIENSKKNAAVAYCRDILIRSKNVMLTAIVVSAAEAYPEKMFDIICDFLGTKEIFHFDTSRFVSEGTASFLLHGDNLFEEERRESNKLPHRSKRLEDIILKYQTDKNLLSEKEYSLRMQKLYSAIDDATININKWQASDKYAYYRMDLRHYREVINVQSDEDGHSIYTVMPDFTEDMRKKSKESKEASDRHFQYMDLQLWSDYKFNGNEKYKEYDKYSNVAAVLKEVEDIWGFLCNYTDNDEFTDQSLLLHRYLSIIPYTCAVLLRDFNKDVTDENRKLCEHIIFELGCLFSEASDFVFSQAGNGVEAVTLGLILLLNKGNGEIAYNETPIYLLLKLVLKDWGHNSCVVKQVANSIWKYSKNDGWKLVYMFSLVADQYEESIMKQRELSTDAFLQNYQIILEEVINDNSIDVTDIDFTKLSVTVTFATISFFPANMKETFIIAKSTKDIVMKLVFGNKYNVKEERRNTIGYGLNYVVWLADVLLFCDDMERKVLVDFLIEIVDITGNDHMQELMKWLIIDQEVYNKIDEFWNVWELFKPKMIELGKKEEHYYSNYNRPIGRDRVITTYLFASPIWRKNVHKCALLSEKRSGFFDDFLEKSESIKAMFYALAKLLNTVGMEPYKEIGIEWIYKLVLKDPGCRITLYDHTLFYLEEYIGNFVACHRTKFREDLELAKKVQAVLEYMVSQGSQIAFFVREEI